MKKIIPVFLLIIFSCTTAKKSNNSHIITEPQVKILAGWSNPHTYIVKVSAKNKYTAIEKAKRKILKDIVYVRIRNNSMYTNIVKIQNEFKIPLQRGKIIKQKTSTTGIEIHYQIRGKNLKKKFERK